MDQRQNWVWLVVMIVLAFFAVMASIVLFAYPASRNPKKDEGGGGGGNQLPPPPPGAVAWDLDRINTGNKNYVLLQLNQRDRVSIDKSTGVLTVTMQPSDGNAESQPPEPKDKGRQRNEVRFVTPDLCVRVGKAAAFALEVRLDSVGDWTVSGESFYHVVQIKSLNMSRPVFTLGIKGQQLTVYAAESSSNTAVMPVRDALKTWVSVNFTVDLRPSGQGLLKWRVGPKSGSYKFDSSQVDKEVFLKLGQYRAFPNSVRTATASSYRNVSVLHA